MGAPNSKLRRDDCFHEASSEAVPIDRLPHDASSEAAPIERLTHEVLCNIFWRIPPTYHLTLSLVCKSWQDTIENPLFAKLQGENGLEMPKFVWVQRTQAYMCSGNFCHGLICLQENKIKFRILMLVDPINKQTIELPRPRRASHTYLGFDHVTCKFKVLGVFVDPSPRSCVNNLFSKGQTNYPAAHLLVQGSTSWRDIDSTFPLPHLPVLSTLVRGVSCWLPYDETDNYKILTFNFVTERFGKIPYPEKLRQDHCALINLRGRLGFVHSEGRFMDIWVLQYKSEIWAFRHRISTEPKMRLLHDVGILDDQKMILLLAPNWVVATQRKAFTYDQTRVVLEKMKMNGLNPIYPNPIWPTVFPTTELGMSWCLITENRIPLHSLWGTGKIESWSSFKRERHDILLRMIEALHDSVKEVEAGGSLIY